jgi:hypothetical protein
VYANYVLGFLQIVFCDLARETIWFWLQYKEA